MVTSLFDTPEWILFNTSTGFTLTPSSPLCVQKSLTIDKMTSRATEQGKYKKPLIKVEIQFVPPAQIINQRPIYGLLGILPI